MPKLRRRDGTPRSRSIEMLEAMSLGSTYQFGHTNLDSVYRQSNGQGYLLVDKWAPDAARALEIMLEPMRRGADA